MRRAVLFGLSWCVLVALAHGVQAQPTLPAEPELPKLPTTPDVPPLPAAPAEPSPAVPAGADADAPAATRGMPSAPQGPTAVLEGSAREVELQIDDKPQQPSDGLPASLPKALRERARPKGASSQEQTTPSGLTIEEIVNPPVSSVSNSVEGALKAPAWTIILTSRELAERGYTDLSQLLDDLPGMDVVRTYGVDYVRAYGRGFRSDVGKDPYLLLVDGQPYTSLFFGDAQILTALPLSNVDHVEIVYGPASVVHGENASTGLINIVTVDGRSQQQEKDFGSRSQVRTIYGGAQRNLTRFADATKIVDATSSWVNSDWRVRVSARVERSVLDRSIGENFEFTRDEYYADPDLWGQSVLDAYPHRAGKFRSTNEKLALDARVAFGSLELGGAWLSHASGFGTEYPADQIQTQGAWISQERSVWLRYVASPLPAISSTTLLRYRQSDISPASFYLQRQAADEMTPAGVVLANESVEDHSFEFQEQLDINVAKDLITRGDELKLTIGIALKALQLSDAIQTSASVFYPNGDVSMGQTTDDEVAASAGRHAAEQAGIFVLGNYTLSPSHSFNVGGRLQHQNDQHFKLSTTPLVLRAAYVGTFEPVTVKALYGEAMVAPSPYELSTAKKRLHNATTRNLELNATVTFGPVSVTVAGFRVDYRKPVVFNTTGTNNFAFNADHAQAMGIDAAARLLLKPFQFWLYYSRYLQNEVRVLPEDEWRELGDLARDKLWGGITYDQSRFSATLLGRFVGTRNTVPTNPLGEIPWYVSLDANVVFKDLFFDGGSVALRCTNLLDSNYSHPGIGAADSGDDPSVATRGELNSALPQPRRSFYLSLLLDL